jgi:hypothetical protein
VGFFVSGEAAMTDVRFKVDLSKLKPAMRDVFKKQLPYATALALTATGGYVAKAWQDEEDQKLDRPTPFTKNSTVVVPARKAKLETVVFVKDIAAAYLQPFVVGGVHSLGKKKAILAPKNSLPLNAYGNLPRGKLASLKGRKDVFAGPVKLKSGLVISGVWQRGQRGERRKGGYGTKGSHNIKHNEAMGLTGYNNRTTLKLLIRFSDPLPVKPALRFHERAEQAVTAHFQEEFAKAWVKAKATAH